ncbi:MAG: hypothetical protein ABIK38_07290 [candidate division WOR-3 bacterium]
MGKRDSSTRLRLARNDQGGKVISPGAGGEPFPVIPTGATPQARISSVISTGAEPEAERSGEISLAVDCLPVLDRF